VECAEVLNIVAITDGEHYEVLAKCGSWLPGKYGARGSFHQTGDTILIFGTRCETKRRMFLLLLSLSLCPLSPAQTNSQPLTRWDRQTYTTHSKHVVLIGGSMHYFRIPAAE